MRPGDPDRVSQDCFLFAMVTKLHPFPVGTSDNGKRKTDPWDTLSLGDLSFASLIKQ